MSTIGGEGPVRWTGEPGPGLSSDLAAQFAGSAAPARATLADTMERARGFGPFGGPAGPVIATPPTELQSISTIGDLVGMGQVGVPSTVSATEGALGGLWGPLLTRIQEVAPALVNGIVPMSRAESALGVVREGLAQLGKEDGFWARAQRAASEDLLGKIAGRFEGLRERLEARLSGEGHAIKLGSLAHELHGKPPRSGTRSSGRGS